MDLFAFDPPDLERDEVSAILVEHWGLHARHQQLRGERSHNSLVTDAGGERFVLHVVSASERPDVVDLQTSAMLHLERHAADVPTPRVIPTVDGASLAVIERRGATHLARLVTFVPGEPFDPSEPLPVATFRAVGSLLGRVAAALADLSHPAADHFMPWDIANGLIVDADLRASVRDAEVASLVEELGPRLEVIAATMDSLPRSTIHNDGHAGNLMRRDDTSNAVAGLIDFGDVVHTVTAADVAIAAESFATGHREPDRVLAEIAVGYHEHTALSPAEIDALPDLVLARAVLGLMLADHQVAHAPHIADEEAALLRDRVLRTREWIRLDRRWLADAVHTALATALAERSEEER